jgi:hypothetical protein
MTDSDIFARRELSLFVEVVLQRYLISPMISRNAKRKVRPSLAIGQAVFTVQGFQGRNSRNR